jgi:GAF domain-containing protein
MVERGGVTMDFKGLKARLKQGPDVVAVLREAAPEICKVFGADRLTIYRTTPDGKALLGVVQTGLENFDAVKVKLESNKSLAGLVGSQGKVFNIADAYDERELAPLHMAAKMFIAVDLHTGFRTRQVLAAPILAPGKKLLGVVELFNRLDKKKFPKECEEDIVDLCLALVPAFTTARAVDPSPT